VNLTTEKKEKKKKFTDYLKQSATSLLLV